MRHVVRMPGWLKGRVTLYKVANHIMLRYLAELGVHSMKMADTVASAQLS